MNTLVHIELMHPLRVLGNLLLLAPAGHSSPKAICVITRYFLNERKVQEKYTELADKVTLKKIREMTFVNVREILGIIYSSKAEIHSSNGDKQEENQEKFMVMHHQTPW